MSGALQIGLICYSRRANLDQEEGLAAAAQHVNRRACRPDFAAVRA
jgi:hypothetical protein